MSQLTGLQLGGLLRQRRYDPTAGQSTHAISLDGGSSWWEFYLDGMEFAIGGLVTHSQPAREEWNPIHAGLSYSVTEIYPGTEDALLVVRFGYPESRNFVFRVRMRPIQLVVIDREGASRDAGTTDGETLDTIEYVGRVEDVLPNWRSEVQRSVR